jgi:hypothetical protein
MASLCETVAIRTFYSFSKGLVRQARTQSVNIPHIHAGQIGLLIRSVAARAY